MSTALEEARITVQVSVEELLKAVDQLPTDQLEAFVSQALLLQARRRAPSLAHDESVLMLKINEGLPEETRARYYALIDKRDAETLTPGEYEELLRLTDEAEEWNVRRVEALVELAQLRQMPVNDLMDSLGIGPPTRE
jgi:hypothetical protein